jgi:hypothetical protein
MKSEKLEQALIFIRFHVILVAKARSSIMKGCAIAGSCSKCCNKGAPSINIKTAYDKAGRRVRMTSDLIKIAEDFASESESISVTVGPFTIGGSEENG